MEDLGNNINEIAGQLQNAATSLISIWLRIQFGAIMVCIAIAIIVRASSAPGSASLH